MATWELGKAGIYISCYVSGTPRLGHNMNWGLVKKKNYMTKNAKWHNIILSSMEKKVNGDNCNGVVNC